MNLWEILKYTHYYYCTTKLCRTYGTVKRRFIPNADVFSSSSSVVVGDRWEQFFRSFTLQKIRTIVGQRDRSKNERERCIGWGMSEECWTWTVRIGLQNNRKHRFRYICMRVWCYEKKRRRKKKILYECSQWERVWNAHSFFSKRLPFSKIPLINSSLYSGQRGSILPFVHSTILFVKIREILTKLDNDVR